MKLYTRAQNSAGERVRIALNLKGIAYEYVAVSTLGPGEYARINPQELLPALEIDGRIITQSAAILNYLEAVFPERPLLPADPVIRAQAIAFWFGGGRRNARDDGAARAAVSGERHGGR